MAILVAQSRGQGDWRWIVQYIEGPWPGQGSQRLARHQESQYGHFRYPVSLVFIILRQFYLFLCAFFFGNVLVLPYT